MMRRPPRSPLFPYTTLFRSFERVRAALAPKGCDVLRELGSGGMGAVFLARQVALDWLVAIKVLRPELATADGAERFHREARPDRESTRLNSSHRQNSYAVFC